MTFNSLCEIRARAMITAARQITFNSLCEIRIDKWNDVDESALTFNSLCEIPEQPKPIELTKEDIFQFSV